MSIPKRSFLKNSFYHIYNRGNNKEQILRNPEDKSLFVNLIHKYKRETGIYIDTYVIMSNHFHLIVRTGNNPKNISKYMQKICVSYSMVYNRKHDRVGHLFQGRFNAKYLRYKKDLKQTREYILHNPIEEGYVRKGADYPWFKPFED